MGKGILLAVIILCLFAAEVDARTACGPVTVWGATAGAYIHGDWTYIRGSSGFDMQSDGGQPLFDNPDGPSCGTCSFSMITLIDNPTLWTTGGGNDACRYSSIDFINPQGGFVQIALSSEDKAEAQWWSDGFSRSALFCQA